jgi:hypothetical protein
VTGSATKSPVKFVCVRKCFFLLRRWKVGQVFTYQEGGVDQFTGRLLQRPPDVGLGKYFQAVPEDFVPPAEEKPNPFKVRRKRIVGVGENGEVGEE